MAVIKKKGRKAYYVVIYSNKKHHWYATGTEDLIEAQQIELDMRRVMQQRKQKKKVEDYVEKIIGDKIERRGMKLSHCWDNFLKQPGAQTKASTLKSKKNIFLHFINWININYPDIEYIHEVNRDIAVEYTEILRKEKAAQTFNNYKNNITNVIRNLMAIPTSGIIENVFEIIITAKKTKGNSYRAFSDDEMLSLEKLLIKDYSDSWYYAFIIAKYTGLRLIDVVHINTQQVDFADNIITLQEEKVERFGNTLHIPMHPNLRSMLEKIKPSNDGYYIPKLVNTYRTAKFDRAFGKILKFLNISKNKYGLVGFHSLRHTLNTELERAGVPQAIRRKITGHQDDRVNDIYSHAFEPVKDAILQLK